MFTKRQKLSLMNVHIYQIANNWAIPTKYIPDQTSSGFLFILASNELA